MAIKPKKYKVVSPLVTVSTASLMKIHHLFQISLAVVRHKDMIP